MRKTSKLELCDALAAFELPKNQTYIVHSSLYSLGVFEGGCSGIVDCLSSVLGENATICMPTFTFSFTKRNAWCYWKSKSETGALTDFYRRSSGVDRSIHPIHSIAVKGLHKSNYTNCNNLSSFGPNNPFEKLIENDAINIGLGVGLVGGATFLHYAEEASEVPYRFMKNLFGIVLDRRGTVVDAPFKMFARKTDKTGAYENDWRQLSADLKEKNMIKSGRLGYGEIMFMKTADCHDFLMNKLRKNPYYIAIKREERGNVQ